MMKIIEKIGVFSVEKVCKIQNYAITLHSQMRNKLNANAKIAQLVEHDLAKVGVAGSSPVFRS